MAPKTIDMPIRHHLSEQELAERGQQLAALHAKVAQAKDHMDAEKAQFKAVQKDAEAEARALVEALNQEWEERKVKCRVELDYQRCERRIVRLDTGEVLKSETLTRDELQMELDLERGGTWIRTLIPIESGGVRLLEPGEVHQVEEPDDDGYVFVEVEGTDVAVGPDAYEIVDAPTPQGGTSDAHGADEATGAPPASGATEAEASDSGTHPCPACSRRVKLRRDGSLSAHGPTENRCAGTGMTPTRISEAAPTLN